MRSHKIAPTKPANSTYWVTASNTIIPDPKVFATFVPKPKAATKLKKAAHRTAKRGVNTRVETTVAMELAASWKPLMKSKISAITIMVMTNASTVVLKISDHLTELTANSQCDVGFLRSKRTTLLCISAR